MQSDQELNVDGCDTNRQGATKEGPSSGSSLTLSLSDMCVRLFQKEIQRCKRAQKFVRAFRAVLWSLCFCRRVRLSRRALFSSCRHMLGLFGFNTLQSHRSARPTSFSATQATALHKHSHRSRSRMIEAIRPSSCRLHTVTSNNKTAESAGKYASICARTFLGLFFKIPFFCRIFSSRIFISHTLAHSGSFPSTPHTQVPCKASAPGKGWKT